MTDMRSRLETIYQRHCDREGLPAMSADELVHELMVERESEAFEWRNKKRTRQIQWLYRFLAAWEWMEAREQEQAFEASLQRGNARFDYTTYRMRGVGA